MRYCTGLLQKRARLSDSKKANLSYSVETKPLFLLENHAYLKAQKKDLNMPFETLIDDEMLVMDELLEESGKTLKTHQIEVPLGSIMNQVPSVQSGASLQEALNLMVSHDIGSIFVVADKKLKGVIGERDILLKVLNKSIEYEKLIVDDFMKVDPLTLRPDDLLDTAIQEIAQGGFRHIPITDKDNTPLGMLSVRNIISYLVEHFPQEVLTLPPKPVRNGTQSREGA